MEDVASSGRTYSIDTVLEYARGIAALWVFMFHITSMFGLSSPFLQTIARYGYQGVALFFVISGYCMFAAAEKTVASNHKPSQFLMRRIIRVFPPFWLSIVVVVLMPYLLEGLSALHSGKFSQPFPLWLQFSSMDWLQLLTLTKIFSSQGGDLQEVFSPVNSVYWTLAIEFQFYLVIYVAMHFRSIWKKILACIFLISLVTFFLPYIDYKGFFIQFWPSFSFGVLLRILHQMGVTPSTVFRDREKLISLSASSALFILVLVSIFVEPCAIAFFCSKVPNLTFTMASGFSAVLLWFLGGVEHSSRRAPDRVHIEKSFWLWVLLPFSWLGQASYSVYLLHGKLYQLPEMFIRQFVSLNNIAYPLLVLLTTIAMCIVFYRIFEKPFQHGGKKIFSIQSNLVQR
ncbi:acyltransferase family protein [Undibacterium sp.]|uniref:acyltransferase family protein n=1 Tax=Undibacterium sp. TaxID=1914977 RepID=UPI00374D2F11